MPRRYPTQTRTSAMDAWRIRPGTLLIDHRADCWWRGDLDRDRPDTNRRAGGAA